MWKARDTRLNRIVALKFLLAGSKGLSGTDLVREARAASALNHPNIVTILEIGDVETDPYIAMEFVEGETLRARMERGISLDESLRITSQVCAGLAAAHAVGIVHRDLKPENIMLRVDNLVKLVDFGLAKLLPWSGDTDAETAVQTITASGHIVGTVSYMSPEQVRGQKVEPSSDVFSFGIVSYELLTGRHPFRAETTMDTLSGIINKEPDPVKKLRLEVPVGISDVVQRCLRKQPTDRFSTASEVAERLNPHIVDIKSKAVSPASERSTRPFAAVLGIAAILLLLLAVAWLTGLFNFGAARTAIQSVAVMNIKVSSPQAGDAFGEDFSQSLGSALAGRGLLVAARSTVGSLDPSTDPRSLGEKLNVDAVLQGEMRGSGSSLRLYLELVDTRTGFQVWSRTITLDAGALVTPSEEIATTLAEQISTELRGQR
ncbi:MAG: protein kinase [Acidobacteria bacterium]|nr:protein kinase [Acidobacteriota bacterium]